MKHILSLVILVLAFSIQLFAQPETAWWHMYDYGHDEHLYDIYRIPNDGYILCGRQSSGNPWNIIITRIDNAGNEIWHSIFGNDGQRHSAYSVIETDNSTFMVACYSQAQVAALHVDSNGEQIWLERFAAGWGYAVIELKDGEYWICGGSNGQGYIVCFDIDGDVIWDERYGNDDSEMFYSMRETQGGVVLCGQKCLADDRNEIRLWVVKVDFNGDILWERNYEFNEDKQYGYSMVSTQDEGFIIGGRIESMDILLTKVDSEGRLVWHRVYEPPPDNTWDWFTGVERLDDGGFAMVGGKDTRFNINNYNTPFIIRVTPDGIERWQALYTFDEDNGFGDERHCFFGLTTGDDNAIIACGTVNYCRNEDGQDEGQNGLVMKLEYDYLAPQFIYYEPEDTVLSVLPGDRIDFLVRAINAYHDEIHYLWTLDGDSIDNDTTVTVPFDELGEYEVRCEASNEEGFIASITWHVTARDFYIADFTPDSTEMTIRRNSTVDFGINVRALDYEGLNYYWNLYDRAGNREEVSDTDSTTVTFDLTGEYSVEGVVWRENLFDQITWAVNVRSCIWHCYPEDVELTVSLDTTIEFEVLAFNPESDSLGYFWTLNDDPLDNDTTVSLVEIQFPTEGNQTVDCLVHDGCEEDSVTWLIDVFDPRDVAHDPKASQPQSVSLSDPSPNPFNASTNLSYSLSSQGNIQLKLFDLTGRELAVIEDGFQEVGRHTTPMDASTLPSGLYLVKLEACGEVRTVKMICVK